MNREQYMKRLKKRLRHLPKDEFGRAVAYFEEYFDEAGAGQELQAISDLGTPEEAAGQIIQDMAVQNTAEPVTDLRRGMSAVWVGILAVFAAPFTVPVFAVAVVMAFLVLAMVVLLLVLLLLTGVLLLISGPVAVFGGFSVLRDSVGAACICFGRGLAAAGIGILLMQGMYALLRRFLNWLVRLFGEMVRKGDEKDV